MIRRPPRSTLFPTRRSSDLVRAALCNDLYTARLSRQHNDANVLSMGGRIVASGLADEILRLWLATDFEGGDRKSTRLNSSHANISYAVFCLKNRTAII